MTLTIRSMFVAAALCAGLTACDSGNADAKKTAEPAKPAPAKDVKPAEPAEPAKPATPEPPKAEPVVVKPADPATFVPADLSVVPSLAAYTVSAPPDATVTADPVAFGSKEPTGVVIEKDGFKLHVWRGTIGGERTTYPIRAKQHKFTYTETKNEGEKGLLEYSIEKDGKTGLGLIMAKFSSAKGGSVLCGPADPVADAAVLEPYRKACETVAEKKAEKKK